MHPPVSVAASTSQAERGRGLRLGSALAAARRCRGAVAVGALAAAAAVGHAVLAWARPTPGYFPDEYIYAELGRSLAEGTGPLVRDAPSHFAPLLYPLLTAPAWLADEVATGYRLVQGLNALTMSLAVVPAFLLARTLGLGRRLALACAALVAAAPTLLYSSWVMAEPLAYPLAIGAAACVVALFDRPTVGLQVALLAFSAAAVFTRVQLAAIPLCYLITVVAVGLRGRRLRALAAQQRLAVGVLGAVVAVAGGAGLRGHFGYYPSFTYVQAGLVDALAGTAATSLVLAFSSGWAIVPGALLGTLLAIARPRSRAESAFGVFTAALTVTLVAQASLYGDTANVQERYAVYAFPLVVVAFGLYAARGWPLLRAHALLAAMLAAVAALVPLAGYAAAQGSAQSLLLSAHQGAALALGDVASASLAFALSASALSGLVLVVAWRAPARATVVATVSTLAVLTTLTAAAFSFYQAKRTVLREALLPSDPSWVDHAHVGDVTLLVGLRGARADLHTTLFWNRTVDRVAVIEGAESPDVFAAARVTADAAGRLHDGGRPLRGPLLVDGYGVFATLRDAERIGVAPTKTLWRPRGDAQLALLMVGRYHDGRVAAEGAVQIWPPSPAARLAGWFELELALPPGAPASGVRLRLPGGETVAARVDSGERALLRAPVCSAGRWTAVVEADAIAIAHGGRVGPSSEAPVFVADAAACER